MFFKKNIKSALPLLTTINKLKPKSTTAINASIMFSVEVINSMRKPPPSIINKAGKIISRRVKNSK